MRVVVTFRAGESVGRRRSGESIVLERDVNVDLVLDDGALYQLARKAARNKSRKAVSGPATATVRRS